MKRFSAGFFVLACACSAGASVETHGAAAKPLVPGTPAPAPVVRPGTFAAASAASARRLDPGQREEWRFLKDAAAAGRFEHDAAQLALAKSSDPALRSLAASLVNHQSGSLPALQQMLRARSMAPPMLSNEQRRRLNRLVKVRGPKFDREWMEWVALRSQQETVQGFEKAAVSARDPQLRAWIARTLPALRYQLASAGRIVHGGTKFAVLAPLLPATVKAHVLPGSSPALATRAMGAGPPPPGANPDNLGEGNMVLGPPRSAAATLAVTAPNSR